MSGRLAVLAVPAPAAGAAVRCRAGSSPASTAPAARHAARLPWTKDGRVAAHGAPGQTVTAERPAAVHGGRARVDGLRVAPEGAA